MAEPPQTLVHGDVRMDNLMFGTRPDHRPVVAIDWVTNVSAGIHDLAYLLSHNMPTLERRAQERRLVARYAETLGQLGVARYAPEQAWRDYRTGLLYLLGTAIVIAGTLDPANSRGQNLMQALLQRSSQAVLDHDLLQELP